MGDLERTLRFKATPEKSLYKWCINELDGSGAVVGPDWIPMPWRIHFIATDVHIRYISEVDSYLLLTTEHDSAAPKHRQTISAELKPYHPRGAWRTPSVSMFGSAEKVEAFNLEIYPAADGMEEGVRTSAYEASEDNEACVYFQATVPKEVFNRYLVLFTQRLVDQLTFTLKGPGFYSEWVPDIDPREIKILTSTNRESIEALSPEPEPPVIGKAKGYDLSLHRSAIVTQKLPQDDEPDLEEDEPVKVDPTQHPTYELTKSMAKTLTAIHHWLYFIALLAAGTLIGAMFR